MEEVEHILLRTEHVSRNFGGVSAVRDVSLTVRAGRVQGLIGPNGAGKTTFFNLISGLIPVSSGKIFLGNADVTHYGAHRIAAAGVGRTFQKTRLFNSRSVLENLVAAQHVRTRVGFWSELVGSPRARKEWKSKVEKAREQLYWIGLDQRERGLAGALPLRDQKLLSIAMAMAIEPRILLLDEPTAGLDPEETDQMKNLVRRLQQEKDLAILIIEHKMKFVMELSEHVVVLSEGTKLAEGSPEQISGDERVIQVYLGAASGQRGM